MGFSVDFEELSWSKVKYQVKQANPELAKMIDEFDPGKDYSFIKVSYPYGAKILDHGIIQLPTNTGEIVPLNHEVVPKSLQKKLQYSSVPMGLLLNRAMEVYFETNERVMPSKLFPKGTCFGLWEVYDKNIVTQENFIKSIWNLSAGARSLFMLPRISDVLCHSRLKRDFGLSEYAPKDLLGHNRVFKELAAVVGDKAPDPWRCEVLFFTEKWSQCDTRNINSLRLHNYWLQTAWDQSLNCRRPMDYSVVWEVFANEVSRRNLKVRPYIINIIKHLIAISDGVFPGFVAAHDDSAAPIKLIQDCYINSYLLRDYAPIIMQPLHIQNANQYVYYSMNFPTVLEWAAKSKISGSVMSDIRELKMLIELFINTTEMSNMQYEYFHTDEDHLHEILRASKLCKDDPDLLHPLNYKNNQQFPENGPFLRGCIRVQKIAPLLQKWIL